LRILQVCPDSYSEIGGISFHVKSISERLAKRHDVTVFATNARGLLPWREIVNGVKVERFRAYAPTNAYMFTVDMPLRMRKERFDVVHAHGYHAIPLHLARFAKGDCFVATTHFHGAGHSSFRNALIRLLKPFGRDTLNKADAIVAVSDFEKALICHDFDFQEEKVRVIPNGVDFSEFEGLRKQNHESSTILYVGYLAAYKGPQYLVEVLPKLPKDVILKIVGNGPIKPLLEKRASQLSVSDRVQFYSNVPKKVLIQMYADADVFALLSRYEAYSMVVAEALAARTPCIVARTSALTEWEDDSTCFGVDFPINLDKLVEQINYVLSAGSVDTDFRKWYDRKILDWDQVAEKLETLYISNRTCHGQQDYIDASQANRM
jgi:glycosyltransferase involved in cell wall biosynthesis